MFVVLCTQKIISACDLSDPIESGIVAGSLTIAWQETITALEVAGSSKSDFTDGCKEAYDDYSSLLTTEQLNSYIDLQIAGINAITTTDCATMMGSLASAIALI